MAAEAAIREVIVGRGISMRSSGGVMSFRSTSNQTKWASGAQADDPRDCRSEDRQHGPKDGVRNDVLEQRGHSVVFKPGLSSGGDP